MKTIIFACVVLFLSAEIASGAVLKKTDPKILAKANRITIPFVKNKGQLENADILYYANTFAGRVTVNKDGSIVYRLSENERGKDYQALLVREMLGATSKNAPTGEHKAVAKANYFEGKDSQKWVTDIPTFNSVNMGAVYPGVSLKLQAHGNNVEKIFAVRPGVDPKRIRLDIDGAKALRMTTKGELEVHTGTGSLRFTRPVAFQWIDGIKTPVDIAYTVKGKSYGFKLAAYDTTKELISIRSSRPFSRAPPMRPPDRPVWLPTARGTSMSPGDRPISRLYSSLTANLKYY
ncbi:MAG: hypothetical protein P8010_22595 [Desulfosarcinaceae bacterium]|jgi:hypothetical protein